MNKKELISEIAIQSNCSRSTVATILNTTMTCISNALIEKKNICLQEFGTFSVQKISTRNRFNPSTKENIVYPESSTVKFTVARGLRQKVKE